MTTPFAPRLSASAFLSCGTCPASTTATTSSAADLPASFAAGAFATSRRESASAFSSRTASRAARNFSAAGRVIVT